MIVILLAIIILVGIVSIWLLKKADFASQGHFLFSGRSAPENKVVHTPKLSANDFEIIELYEKDK